MMDVPLLRICGVSILKPFFCVFEICRAAFYRNTPQAELAFIRKGKKKVEGAESKAKLYSLQPAI